MKFQNYSIFIKISWNAFCPWLQLLPHQFLFFIHMFVLRCLCSERVSSMSCGLQRKVGGGLPMSVARGGRAKAVCAAKHIWAIEFQVQSYSFDSLRPCQVLRSSQTSKLNCMQIKAESDSRVTPDPRSLAPLLLSIPHHSLLTLWPVPCRDT